MQDQIINDSKTQTAKSPKMNLFSYSEDKIKLQQLLFGYGPYYIDLVAAVNR